MSRRLPLLVLLLALLGSLSAGLASGAARFYTPDYGSKTPEEIGGFDLADNGALSPISGSPFPAANPGVGGIFGLAFTPDGTRAVTGYFFDGGVQGFSVPPSGVFQLAGSPTSTASVPAVAISPDGRYAFASTREFMGKGPEGVHRFAVNPDGSLTSLGAPTPLPGDSYDIAISPDGRFLFAEQFNGVERFAIGADGSLSPLGFTPLPGAYLLATAGDSGLLFVLLDSGGGTGVASFAIGADGGLSQRGSTVELGITSTKVFAASPDGRHVFVPNRNADVIRTVEIGADGSPTALPGGLEVKVPEAVGVSPDSRHLVFYRGGGSENALGSAAINSDGTLAKFPFETPWTTGEPEPLVFQPHPAPVARFSVRPGAPGAPAQFDAAASERVARYDWDFGDGTVLANGGPAPVHIYANAGTYPVTLRVTDGSGCSSRSLYNGHSTVCPGGASPVTSVSVDTLPVLGKVKAKPKKFRAKPKGKGKGKFGTTFRYRVNEAATVRFAIERRIRFGPVRRCLARTPECMLRFKRIGSRRQAARAGANKLKWNGRLKGRPLRPGSYRATVVATDKAGGRSAPQTVRFRILPPQGP